MRISDWSSDVCSSDLRRERRRTAVNRMEAIGFHIIGKARRAADAADDHGIFGRGADLGHRVLDRLHDRILAAAGTPADFLIGLPIPEWRRARCSRHPVPLIASTRAAALSTGWTRVVWGVGAG